MGCDVGRCRTLGSARLPHYLDEKIPWQAVVSWHQRLQELRWVELYVRRRGVSFMFSSVLVLALGVGKRGLGYVEKWVVKKLA